MTKPISEYPEILTIQEACSLLRISNQTIKKWETLGKLSSYRVGPRRDRRYKKEDILQFLGFRKEGENK